MSRLPLISRRGRADAVWFGGAPLEVLVDGDQSAGALGLSLGEVRPGSGPPPHVHGRDEEFFYLLDGELVVHVGGQEYHATPGAFVGLPKGVAHGFMNPGSTNARMLGLVAPSGTERILLEVGSPLTDRPPAGPPDRERMYHVSRKYGSYLLGPGVDTLAGSLPYGLGRHATVVARSDGFRTTVGSFTFKLKASETDTAGAYTALEVAAAPAAELSRLRSEVFEIAIAVLRGSLHAETATEDLGTAEQQDSLSLPRCRELSLQAGPEGCDFLLVTTPGGFEHVLADAVTTAGPDQPDLSHLALAGRPLGVSLTAH